MQIVSIVLTHQRTGILGSNPRKIRKPVTLKALRSKRRPTAWLRMPDLPLDFGVKVTTTGPGMQMVSKPDPLQHQRRDPRRLPPRRLAPHRAAVQPDAGRPLGRPGDLLLHLQRLDEEPVRPRQHRHRLPRLGLGAGGRRGGRLPQGELLPGPLPRTLHERAWPPRLLHPRQVGLRGRAREGGPQESRTLPERPPARPGLRHRAVRDQGPPAGHDVGRRRTGSRTTRRASWPRSPARSTGSRSGSGRPS